MPKVFKSMLGQHGITVQSTIVEVPREATSEIVERCGYDATTRLIQAYGDQRKAMLFTDDYLARGGLTALLASGIRVPEQWRVASFVNCGHQPIFPVELTRIEVDPIADGRSIAGQAIAMSRVLDTSQNATDRKWAADLLSEYIHEVELAADEMNAARAAHRLDEPDGWKRWKNVLILDTARMTELVGGRPFQRYRYYAGGAHVMAGAGTFDLVIGIGDQGDTLNGNNSHLLLDNFRLTTTAIPEPASLGLLAMGSLILLRRSNKQRTRPVAA